MTSLGLGRWIQSRARSSPGRMALRFGDRSWTYAEFASRVRSLANALVSVGVRPGDRVAWVGPNHPAFLELLFATGTLGAVTAPVNHRLDRQTISRIIEDAEPSAILLCGPMADLRTTVPVRVAVDPSGEVPGAVDYETLVAGAPDDQVDEPVGLDTVCMIPFTSGTTGLPKGVMLTHGNVTWNAVNMVSSADLRHDDVTVAIAPFFRAGGTGVNVLPVLFMGGTIVIPASNDPDEILGLIERHRLTVGFGNPDLLDALTRVERWGRTDLSSLRFIITGGAPVPERLIRAYLERRVTLLQGYGLSEAGPVVLLLDPADALTKVGAAGKPPPLVDVRIVGADGTDMAAGEIGELLVRGPNVMAGYWRRPDATRMTIDAEGWLRTGDAVRMDQEGDVWIVDRVADGYLTAGGPVYPNEVERALASHPSVVDAGVVGVPRQGGYGGAAFVVLAPGAEATEADLLAHCRERLAPHAVPVSVSFVDALPRNSVGKLVRSALGDLLRSS